ncbi:hypothetical protein [Vitiosangium sp. GDMCC 1.1324]|uniref:hypothetical protein n=1 Tax=Vitiosangium sp. (strain GDMCC 1.1324) TaxID=2138576 RepID=UPI000D3AA3D3|nr:hypothetical protein [Vitiosangium sp. GDMCC 1.1324]PTL84003.1 hypothetical protein DAT35_11130 [Vitiosangium sp. GDMCC 1.1324]
MKNLFLEALAAPGPHPSLGEHAATYGRLIGSWAGEVHDHAPDGRVSVSNVEIHFAWVLEGRAIQDLWISPTLAERASGGHLPERYRYGTTLRIFDPELAAWRVVWQNPVIGTRSDLIGRRQGDDIVQVGMRDARPIRWTFLDITPQSFVWRGHILEPDGETWWLESEFRVRRTGMA